MTNYTLPFTSKVPYSPVEFAQPYQVYLKRANCCGLVEVDYMYDFLYERKYFRFPEPEKLESIIDSFLLLDMYQSAWVIMTDHCPNNPFIEPFLEDLQERGLIAKMFSTDYVINENSCSEVRAFMVRFNYDAVKERFAKRHPNLLVEWTLTAEQARIHDEELDSLWGEDDREENG